MVFNAIFNTISIISWRSVLLVEENHWQTLSHISVSSTPAWDGFELTTLVVIGTDWIGSYKSNYNTITITTVLRSHMVEEGVPLLYSWYILLWQYIMCVGTSILKHKLILSTCVLLTTVTEIGCLIID
jgi:hypothetical protein